MSFEVVVNGENVGYGWAGMINALERMMTLEHPESDPTAIEPDDDGLDEPEEDSLPEKPPIEDMPPEEGVDVSDLDEDEDEDDFMSEEDAADDDTIDDTEVPQRNPNIPKGARREDYAKDIEEDQAVEKDDSEEETPPFSRGQRRG